MKDKGARIEGSSMERVIGRILGYILVLALTFSAIWFYQARNNAEAASSHNEVRR